MKKAILLIFILLIPAAAFSINAGTGTNPENFLKFGGGVRAISMGNAFVGIADDTSAIYWNPAGIAQIKQLAFSSMYSSMFMEMSYTNLSFTSYIPNANISTGVSIDYVNAGKIEETSASSPYGTGRIFNPSFLAITMPVASQIADAFSFGLNMKMIADGIDTSEAIGYGVDLGLLWKMTENMSAGFCARNLMGGISLLQKTSGAVTGASQSKSDLASNYAVGFAYSLSSFKLAVDYNIPSDNTGVISVGGEYNLNKMFFGRLGFNTRSEENAGGNLSAGLGMKLGTFDMDYAYSPYGDLGISHRFSIGFTMPEGKKPKTASSGEAVSTPSVEAIPAPSAEVKAVTLEAGAVKVPSLEAAAVVSTEAITIAAAEIVKPVIKKKPLKKKAKVIKKPVKKRKR